MRLRALPGQVPQPRQQHAGRVVEAQVRDPEIQQHVLGAVLAEGAVLDAGGVVDDDFGTAEVGDGAVEGGGEGGVVGGVGGVGADGEVGGGGGDEDEGVGEVAAGAGDEGDVGEGVGGEEPGDVGAYHRAGTDDEEGARGGHCVRSIGGWGGRWYRRIWSGGTNDMKGLI